MPKSIAELTPFMDQLTKSLDSLAEGVNLIASDEVAELLAQFNQLVPECDGRLHLCAGLLAKGLRDEALGYEADEPALLETVTLLDLSSRPQWPRWLEAMTSLGFPRPAMPKVEVAVELREAQERVVALKPLLDQWRRANLANAPLRSRISILRRLRGEDPNNETWFECLRAHENSRFMEIEADVKEALASRNEGRLAELVDEMNAQWLEPPPKRVRKAAETGLDSFRGSRVDAELDQAADALATAMEARDLDAARDIRVRWDRLVSEKGAFTENDGRLEKAAPAVAWIDSHDRMESLFAEVWNSLDARPTATKARREWVRGLTRMRDEVEDIAERLRDEIDVEPIERLRSRVARIEEEHRREESSRRLLAYLTVAAIATVIIGGVATYVSLLRHYERVKSAVTELDSLRQRVERGEYEPEKIPRPNLAESIARDPSVEAKARLLDAAVAKDSDRRKRFAELQNRLAGMLDSLAKAERLAALEPWPVPFVEATKTLAEIEAGDFVRTAADKTILEKDAGLLENAARRFRRDGEEAVAQRTTDLTSRLEQIQQQMRSNRQDAAVALDAIEKEFVTLRGLLNQPAAAGAAGSYADARKTSRNAAQPLDGDGAVAKTLATLRKGIGDQQRLKAAEQDIDAAAGDWPRYVEKLESTAAEFAQQSISKDYREAAKDLPLWRSVAEWNGFVKALRPFDVLPSDRAKIAVNSLAKLREDADKLAFVRTFIDRNEPLVKAFAERDLAEVHRELTEWLNREWLGELAWCVKSGETTYYTAVKPLIKNGEFEYQRQIKQAGVWPKPAKANEDQANAEPSPQRKLADELEKDYVGKIPDATPGLEFEAVLIGALKRTLEADKVEPCLRLLTVRKLVLLGRNVSPVFQSPEANALQNELDDGMGGIPGVEITDLGEFLDPNREQNRAYVGVRKSSERLLARAKRGLGSLNTTFEDARSALLHTNVRALSCVGRLARDAGGAIVFAQSQKTATPSNAELLVIGPNGDAMKIGTCGPDGRAKIEKGSLVAGVPVFVWRQKDPQ